MKQFLDFYPAAIEVQEQVPSILGRTVSILIMTLIITTVAWSIIGKIDVISTANGKIIPAGNTKIVQPLTSGKIAKIEIYNGSKVMQGDILVTLDSTMSKADLAKLEEQAKYLNTQITRLDNLLNGNYNANDLQLLNQLKSHQSELEAINEQITQLESRLQGSKSNVVKYEELLPIITSRANDYRRLLQDNNVSKHQYLEIEERRIQALHDLEINQHNYESETAELNSLKSKKDNFLHDFQAKILEEKSLKIAELKEAEQELIKAKLLSDAQAIKAPISGTVHNLKTYTIGEIVNAGQELMHVVPANTELEIEAKVLNKDIGFIKAGMETAIKVETYPFTQFGLLDGAVENISEDSIEDENLGLVYLAKVRINTTNTDLIARDMVLNAGMSVQVEIKTDKRRIIDYILSPLKKYRHDSLTER